jgi:membrane associated rhomboid family serine protease/TPR repeat protein
MRRAPRLTELPRYPVTAGTALLAIGITLAWWAKGDVSSLLETAMIRRGELWRLVTSIFPHLSLWHLVFNVYWLWVFGTLIEKEYGHFKTAALILLFAVGSSSFEFAFSSGGVGLSGVGYGLFGLLWILSKRDQRFQDAIDQGTIQLFVVWFFICIFTTVTNIMPVANIAHGVGAALGILTGFAVTLPRFRLSVIAGMGAILLFGLWAATLGRPRVNLSASGGYEEAQWGFDALTKDRNQEAVRWFREAVTYRSKSHESWYDLGMAYQRLGDESAAMAAYRKAAELGDSSAESYLGSIYDTGGKGLPKDGAQAVYWYRKAADQGDPGAQNDLAWAYATSSDPAIRNPSAALEYARKAVSSDKNPMYLDTLAEAYYANRQFEDAVKTEKLVLASAPTEHKDDFVKSLEKYERALDDNKSQARSK